MLTCAMGQAHASDTIVPDFMPRSALQFSDEQLQMIQQHDAAIETDAVGSKASKWEDIKGWRALGSRWAAALDAKGNTIALYDLSLPEGILPGFGIEVGVLGGPDFTFRHTIELLKRAHELTSDKKGREHLEQAIAEMDKDPSKADQGLLADDWYKSVPWTKKALSSFGVAAIDSMTAPQTFTLADIDYKKATINHGLFKKAINYLSRQGLDLSKLELNRRADGSYAIRVKADPEALDGTKYRKPSKLADTHDVLQGFWWSVERSAAKMVIGYAVGLIPNSTVAAVVGTVVDRYLTLRFDIYRYHAEAAAEMVQAAFNGEAPYSSYGSLTPAELQALGTSIYLSDVGLSTIWNWITKGSGEKAWQADMADDVKHSGEAHAFLTQKGYQFSDLNPRFTLSTAAKQHKLFLMAKGRWFSSMEPFTGLDYDHPYTQTAINIGTELASTIVHFAGHFIPTFGSFAPTVFDWAVRDQVQGIKKSEARLMAHLEDRELVSHENWDNELSTLTLQQANPFDLMPKERDAYVAKIAAAMHIDRSGVEKRNPKLAEELQ